MTTDEYLKKQFEHQTGNYLEILSRVYEFISNKCNQKGQNWCYEYEIPYKELKPYAYKNISYDPCKSVISNAKNDLIHLGYLKRVFEGDYCTLHIIKPFKYLINSSLNINIEPGKLLSKNNKKV